MLIMVDWGLLILATNDSDDDDDGDDDIINGDAIDTAISAMEKAPRENGMEVA